ncbi:DNA-deoxyinosine glycosylase [Jeongeupia chitinilytica]|uniref:DNA-deoxyinosine glycosylase n=1 Tax=Jeongeupia chitinilytica TaxID=1041641 RepID=A0ABQ3GWT8_9NEIS|nr:DNA-deoxyinosine glycosylase [Jeongeupia chitinilytica]GHD59009.1 DNA-deoxyinosine glycosylase [Jeongeupia chitinilytica]
MLKTSLAPVTSPDTRLLILGSLPGDASLAAKAYYAHPRNAFWPIMSALTGRAIDTLPYDDRLVALLTRGIGLWDVVGSARRQGSLDQALREVETNPLTVLIDNLPHLNAVAFNGQTAYRLGHRQLPEGLHCIALPSTSPAHTMPLQAKIDAWMQLRPFLGQQGPTCCQTGQ